MINNNCAVCNSVLDKKTTVKLYSLRICSSCARLSQLQLLGLAMLRSSLVNVGILRSNSERVVQQIKNAYDLLKDEGISWDHVSKPEREEADNE